MGIFDTTAIVDSIAKSIDDLGTNQANAIIDGFERAAHIIAEKLEELDRNKDVQRHVQSFDSLGGRKEK